MALINNEKYSLFYQRISLIYQRPEVKASLEVILSVFTVTLLIFAAIRPTLANVASLQKKVEDLDSVNKKADNKIAQVFAAQADINKFQDKLHLFDEAIPNEFSYYDMAGRIELIARRFGLTVQTVSVPGVRVFGNGKGFGDWSLKILTKNPSNIIQTGVSFTVTGDPTNIDGFLNEMENLDRLAILDSITLSSEPTTTKGIKTIKANGLVYFYFYSES
ncbi:hypothetical protein A3K29_01405 [Candidatus Collierbacteria bacterium RIFOXYB2_FULL_46_14]|uniref:Uncharacterized protein n=1 Tax=Candidatus Collierbacteria bacterium GW2011_GWA2_46_26 TaxID=1618381 RepID=A0A0G1PJE2_9BACT|nr:MAG: hypothetical protein UW29_C0006G0020 [Candidatus Collierbacteria bacterium GW2011_GWC2_44_13]KKU32807.1 MAG: hypothetical protein UX47_C0007G0051 [Candidatus Collierbacteria bacterium GW2011_GWA2_46_26]OGD72786.1 MAG: hypothetical protein A3K29_01405 [Candidatus Collierbacteria bacterium RIFOXYB2_FULL_46_14]OGD75828.1 MAG: hypothetical protein A3K43_01405 [Candidatus Collierbacteria bacterium RIFOXYA2_FULL_46_20]OGD77164.1 MAG: hypothetical protein A3K39_01405 [Candidatus Collierbacteri